MLPSVEELNATYEGNVLLISRHPRHIRVAVRCLRTDAGNYQR